MISSSPVSDYAQLRSRISLIEKERKNLLQIERRLSLRVSGSKPPPSVSKPPLVGDLRSRLSFIEKERKNLLRTQRRLSLRGASAVSSGASLPFGRGMQQQNSSQIAKQRTLPDVAREPATLDRDSKAKSSTTPLLVGGLSPATDNVVITRKRPAAKTTMRALNLGKLLVRRRDVSDYYKEQPTEKQTTKRDSIVDVSKKVARQGGVERSEAQQKTKKQKIQRTSTAVEKTEIKGVKAPKSAANTNRDAKVVKDQRSKESKIGTASTTPETATMVEAEASKEVAAKTQPAKKATKPSTRPMSNEIWSGPPDDHGLVGGWPEGWWKIVVQRTSGATKGQTDKYWYTPIQKYKLRSIKEVQRFIKALEYTQGDEVQAKKIFKNMIV